MRKMCDPRLVDELSEGIWFSPESCVCDKSCPARAKIESGGQNE